MSTVRLERRIAARPSIVFDAVTTASGIASWWGPDDGPVLQADSDPRVGGEYRVRFRMEDGSEHEAGGVYVVVDPPRRARMTFRWAGTVDDSGPSEVEFVLEPDGDGTRLRFTHTNLRDEAVRDSHEGGWNGALDKLVAHLGKD